MKLWLFREAADENEGEPVEVLCQQGIPRYSISFRGHSHSVGGMVKGDSQVDASAMVFYP